METERPATIHLRNYAPSPYLIETVALIVKLHADDTRVSSRLGIVRNPLAQEIGSPLILDGEDITLHGLSINGERPAQRDFEVEEGKLILHRPPAPPFVLELETSCSPKANTQLSGLYLSNGIYCTQCEAEGFRRITYFLDRPDVLAKFTVRLEADAAEAPVLLANGNLKQRGDIAGTQRHFAVWEDPHPKPCYLFAIVGGRLGMVEGSFTTGSGRKVVLRIYVEPGNENRCDWAMTSIKTAMAWDEKAFGREYDLDIFMVVAVSMFNMGAMENKGLNIFNDKYVLARPESATDTDYTNIEAIIAHEYFHNWTGNRITCRDWFQLCLKEGLTVFRDQEFTSDVRSRAMKRIQDVRTLRAQQFPEDAGPLAHPVRPSSYIEINNFYTATVYEKGAEVVRMMKTLLGPSDFRKAMDLYFERHDGQAATVEDFVRSMADASGKDFTQFFRWYDQAGTPEVTASGRFNARAKTFDLTLTQKTHASPDQSRNEPLHIPLALGLIGANGHDVPLEIKDRGPLASSVVELKARSETYRFANIGSRPVLSINRGFSAPVKLASDLTQKDLLFLMVQDSDSFNRWEAGQTVAVRLIRNAMAKLEAGRGIPEPKAYSDALKECLADRRAEPQFLALMLSLPTDQEIAGEIGRNVDPDLVHRARERVRSRLGQAMERELLRCWKETRTQTPYSPDPESAGKRSLRHAALSLIAAGDARRGARLAYEHFAQASNMTDMIGALSVLIQLKEPQREQALEQFYSQHRGDHLLVDKWFTLQAQIPFPETAARVRELLAHPQFSWQSPNRMRALIGSFAGSNPVAFHIQDGSGYRLLAEIVVRLDKDNPQVAARLASNFKTYKSLEIKRRQHAKRALQSILESENLSRDSFEIVSRSIA